jgi:heme-degrading monooxygenase HmoA
MSKFAPLPDPPYWAVIFSNQLSDEDAGGYGRMADKMAELATTMPGYIGRESARDAEGFAVTVSYWADEDAMRNWKTNAEHAAAQEIGKKRWYAEYKLRVAKIERQYEGPEGR